MRQRRQRPGSADADAGGAGRKKSPDPLRLTAALAEADLDGLAKEAWKEKGVTPAALWAMTPRAFLALFGKNPHDRGSGFDRVEAVRQSNDERGRRGLKPVVPSWL